MQVYDSGHPGSGGDVTHGITVKATNLMIQFSGPGQVQILLVFVDPAIAFRLVTEVFLPDTPFQARIVS